MKTIRTIRNCLPVFQMVCPKQWEDLKATDQAGVRHCDQCNHPVFFCSTDEETLSHARAGHCIAREMPDQSEMPRMYMGRPVKQRPPTVEQEAAIQAMHRESGINDAIRNLNAPRCCPRCQYPAPRWRVTCRVCGFEMGRVPADSADGLE